MLRKFSLLLVYFILGAYSIYAQDSTRRYSAIYTRMDSLQLGLLDTTTSVKVIDTITPSLLMPQDSLRQIRILDSLTNNFRLETFDLNRFLLRYQSPTEKIAFQKGVFKERRQLWLLVTLAVLLVLFSILKNAFSKQLSGIVAAFYSNRALANLNKEESMITSWSFLLLFVQFGFTLGLFFYMASHYQAVESSYDGLKLLFFISIAVILLYLLKILALRVIGFIFDLQKPMAEYTTILYLSYFNASLLFVPLVIAFCLSPVKYGNFYITLGIILLVLIFLSQFLRAAFTILSQHRFSKVYLFLYFCTLEICPMLILIKAVGL